ncbi:MAG: hscB [Flavipsychrobacter sp.]|jgi:molecular chaperone HscB|nr:hscB [Flavipsychrobacter sp.]
MTNYFELYQIPETFRPDQVEVKSKFYELSRLYHPDRFAQTGGAELAKALQLSAMNNEAYKTFKNPDATMAYILKLHNLLEDEEKYSLPNTFLMEMMDINEAVSDYELEGNEDARQMAVNNLDEQLELWEAATKILVDKFEKSDKSNDLLLQIKDQYFRKKYLLRVKERIDRFAAP